MSLPPPPTTSQSNLTSPNTLTSPTTHSNDEPLSPLSQTFTTKAPPQSLSYMKPSLATSQNWNDLPLSWTHPSCTRPQTSRSSSSTGLDITALYATANPRVAPRKRLSSMINTKAQTSVSAPTTPMTATVPAAAAPPPYQDDVEWKDAKGNVERGERGSVSGVSSGYAFSDDERTRRRARRRRTIKGLAVLLLLITLGGVGFLVNGGPFPSDLSLFDITSGSTTGEGGDASFTFWGYTVSGIPKGGFIEKCKAMSWKPKMPDFLTRYLSDGEGWVEDGEHEIQTITRTIRLTNGDSMVQMPMTVSRIMRGKGPARISQIAADDEDDEETEYGAGVEDWEREIAMLQGRDENGDDIIPDAHNSDELNEAEEQAHRARVSEMWEKHDGPVDHPVTPPEEVEHMGHQEVLEGHQM